MECCFPYFAAGSRAAPGSSSTAKRSAAAQKGNNFTKTTRNVPLPHAITARQIMENSIMHIHFKKFSKDGRMNIDHFKGLCKENEYALTDLEVVNAFVKLDADASGYIDFAEFQRGGRMQEGRAEHLRFESAAMQTRVSEAKEAWEREVGQGMCMNEAQFANHCCKNRMFLLDAELCKKFKSLDKDSNGNLDFTEYLRWRLKQSSFEIDRYPGCNQGTIDKVASFFKAYD